MKKPYVICHMMCTVDGRIISGNWGDEQLIDTFSGYFEKYHETFESQAWMCGRVTMERDFSGGVQPELIKPDRLIKERHLLVIAMPQHLPLR